MVRQRVSHWSRDRSPQDAAYALLGLGLVPLPLRRSDANPVDIVAGVRDALADDSKAVHWVLNTAHGNSEGWETLTAIEDLATVVREALPHGRHVLIECGDALDPEDVLDFFEKEPESAELRSNGWTFATR